MAISRGQITVLGPAQAALPEWVDAWTTGVTKIGAHYVLTPYLFAGSNVDGLATGVSVGMSLNPQDPSPAASIYGYNEGAIAYELSGNVFQMRGLNDSSSGLSMTDPTGSGVRFWAGTSHEDRDDAPFRVLEDGTLYATKAIIDGKITITDPTSNVVRKGTLGSFAYESVNLLDGASSEYESVVLYETIPYRGASTRVGEGAYLSEGDTVTFFTTIEQAIPDMRIGISFASTTLDENDEPVEVLTNVYGDILSTTETDLKASLEAVIPPGTLYLFPFYVFGDYDNPLSDPGAGVEIRRKEQMLTTGGIDTPWSPSYSTLSKNVNGLSLQIENLDGVIRTRVTNEEYLKDMADLKDALGKKANSEGLLTDEGVRSLIETLQTDDYWGIQGVRDVLDVHSNQLTIVTDNMFWNSKTGELVFKTSNSPVSLAITNDRLAFRSGEVDVAWISESMLHIEAATIIDALQVGNHMIEKWSVSEEYTVFKAV